MEIDPKYYRPSEVNFLLGDATKANTTLGWNPKMNMRETLRDVFVSDMIKNI